MFTWDRADYSLGTNYHNMSLSPPTQKYLQAQLANQFDVVIIVIGV